MTPDKKPAQRGRPEVSDDLRRELLAVRLPRWMRLWIESQPGSAGSVIESALLKAHKLKAPSTTKPPSIPGTTF